MREKCVSVAHHNTILGIIGTETDEAYEPRRQMKEKTEILTNIA